MSTYWAAPPQLARVGSHTFPTRENVARQLSAPSLEQVSAFAPQAVQEFAASSTSAGSFTGGKRRTERIEVRCARAALDGNDACSLDQDPSDDAG